MRSIFILIPKIGADGQLCGDHKPIVTPGQHEKYDLADALHSGTGKVSYVGGGSKTRGCLSDG
nr:putative transposase [Serratia symbiotica]